MSREIKFRAWDIEKKKMRHIIMNLKYALHGLIACQWCDGATLDNHWLENNADCVGGKDGFILMQYIGLKDKDGVEEFFDDIVEHTDAQGTRIGVILWDIDMCCMCINFPSTKSRVYGGRVLFEGAKIIGNIHQNGDLLNGK